MVESKPKEELKPGTKVTVFQPPRLPYHQAIEERFGVSASGWKALVEAVYPGAQTVDSVIMALAYCKARNLDPFKRPVHIVPMWDSKKSCYVETVWPGISELRTTAFRTENYAGRDEAEFGPLITHSFAGKVKQKEGWQTKEVSVTAPEWCRVTVYRDLHGRLCKFVGPKVFWLEAYATIGKSDLPNEMWQSRSIGQLEKCAEAAALRMAFPEELGNELTAEEMSGRLIQADDRQVMERVVPQQEDDTPPPPSAVKGGAAAKQEPDEIVVEAEEPLVETESADPALAAQQGMRQASVENKPQPMPASQPDGFTGDEKTWLRDLGGALSGCEDLESFGRKQREVMAPMKSKVSKQAWAKAQAIAEEHYRRLADA